MNKYFEEPQIKVFTFKSEDISTAVVSGGYNDAVTGGDFTQWFGTYQTVEGGLDQNIPL